MLRALALLVVSSGVALADPAPVAEKPAPTQCKKVVVGKGLERHTVCEIAAPVVVRQQAPAPKVLIIQDGGRKVVGRPKNEDRFQGLSHRR